MRVLTAIGAKRASLAPRAGSRSSETTRMGGRRVPSRSVRSRVPVLAIDPDSAANKFRLREKQGIPGSSSQQARDFLRLNRLTALTSFRSGRFNRVNTARADYTATLDCHCVDQWSGHTTERTSDDVRVRWPSQRIVGRSTVRDLFSCFQDLLCSTFFEPSVVGDDLEWRRASRMSVSRRIGSGV
jgi:hypothetical protein